MKRIISLIMVMTLLLSFASVAFAASQSFSFNMTNTGTTSHVYTGTSNKKVNSNDDATIKCTYTDAPGYGYYLGLCNSSYSSATEKAWYGTNGKTRNHAYYDGKAVVGAKYYVSGRIDNDYFGTYSINGTFNADDV